MTLMILLSVLLLLQHLDWNSTGASDGRRDTLLGDGLKVAFRVGGSWRYVGDLTFSLTHVSIHYQA